MAAAAVTVPPGCSYADVMRKARESISLEAVGVGEIRPKRAITEGLLLQIPGEGAPEKAAALCGRLGEVLQGTGVLGARPVKRAELRVSGLDDSVSPEEVAEAGAKAGGLSEV